MTTECSSWTFFRFRKSYAFFILSKYDWFFAKQQTEQELCNNFITNLKYLHQDSMTGYAIYILFTLTIYRESKSQTTVKLHATSENTQIFWLSKFIADSWFFYSFDGDVNLQSTCLYDILNHYNDVIMSAMMSQITSPTIVYSTSYSRRRSEKTPKLRVTGLCAGNSPVTGEFPAQRASNAECFQLMTSSCIITR